MLSGFDGKDPVCASQWMKSWVAFPLEEAEDAIVSFGQGCEGEPLIQWRLLERSIRKLQERTDRGTINLNTNGSFPDRVEKLCEAGLDSVRVTLNSPHRQYYNRYHKPKGYTFEKW
jgi:wyosine [tRNA(Phe)-imidazoG37] synthetase (radical SAM superfamily)